MSAPPAQHDDVQHWMNAFKSAANDPKTITAPLPANAQPWYSGYWDCFQPVDLCLITCCCPCVTFGKTTHRLNHDRDLKGYSPVNASCLGFWLSSYCGLYAAFEIIQRRHIQKKFNLKGDFAMDCLGACCCACCTLMQHDKEVERRLLEEHETGTQLEPKAQTGMEYKQQTKMTTAPAETGVAPTDGAVTYN